MMCEEKEVKVLCEEDCSDMVSMMSICISCGDTINLTKLNIRDLPPYRRAKIGDVAIEHMKSTSIIKPCGFIKQVEGNSDLVCIIVWSITRKFVVNPIISVERDEEKQRTVCFFRTPERIICPAYSVLLDECCETGVNQNKGLKDV